MRHTPRRLVPMLALLALAATGCGPRVHAVTVVPDVSDARVYFDGVEVGQGETRIEVARHDAQARPLRVCGPPGWFCTETTLDARTPETLAIEVPRDNAWHATVDASALANAWHDLPPLAPEQGERAFAQLREALVRDGTTLEVDDVTAYYLRTPWRVAGEPGDRERIRSRVEVALSEASSVEQLVFKLRIESERIDTRGLALAASSRTFEAFVEAHAAAREALAALAHAPGSD